MLFVERGSFELLINQTIEPNQLLMQIEALNVGVLTKYVAIAFAC